MPISKKTLDQYMVELRRIEQHRTEGAEKNIRRIYKALMKDLNGFLGNEYAKYADGDGKLTVAMLQEKSRYARFLEEVEAKIDDITPEYAAAIRKTVEDTYSACYKGMVDAVENSSNTVELADNLKGLSVRPEVMKQAVENPVSGLTLPDVLEKHRKEIIYGIKQELNIALMNGDRYDTVTKKLADRLDISNRKAATIVRTETHRVQEGGFMDCAVDISKGLEGSDLIYTATWRTMKDNRVRPQVAAYKRKAGVMARKKYTAGVRSYLGKPNHVKMEGVTVEVGEKFDLGNGVKTVAPSQSGVAGHDCNCRCFLDYDLMTIAEFEKATGKKADFGKRHYKKSVQAEPKITEDLKNAVANSNGELGGLEYRLKTESSYYEKLEKEMQELGIGEKAAANNMRDVVRYTALCSKENLIDDYSKIISNLNDKGYTVVRVKNTFKKDAPYKGINTIVQNENGFNFELQFHTPQSFELKNGILHELYEKERLTTTSKIEKQALRKQMEEISESIVFPDNVAAIKSFNNLR